MAEYDFITTSGVIIPDTADLRAGVEAEWRAAFGADLRVSNDTPQGVMITMETLARAAVAENNAALANQVNPDLAGGVFLDALCALLGLYRTPATRTAVPGAVLTGQPLTWVPAGVKVRSAAGDLFQTAGAVQLSAAGSATVELLSVDFGPVGAPANTITTIVDLVLGWETVNNPNDGVPGTAQQSDASLRDLRRRTLARQGISTPEAIISEVSALPNVRSMQFRENIANTVQVIDGISMLPHSVWVCVDGGEDQAVALALLANKTAGAAWNGATSVTVIEPSSGQSYAVLFDRPEEVNILARITVRQGMSVVDAQAVIPGVIVAYANGQQDGERGFIVGGNVSPFELAGAINREYPGLFVALVEVMVAGGSWQAVEIPIAVNQVARIQASSVTVVVV